MLGVITRAGDRPADLPDRTEGVLRMLSLGAADANDDSLKALDFILEAWEEGTGRGIAPEMMAYAALYTALTDLVAAYGETSVVAMVNGLGARVERGEFTLRRRQ